MRSILYIVIAASLIGCASASDPIDRLVTKCSANALWRYGVFPTIKLPETASIDDVVEQTIKVQSFYADGSATSGIRPFTKVKSFKIIKVRKVCIRNDQTPFTVVLLQTDFGEKIVIFRYEPKGKDFVWWSQVYDAKSSV